MLLDRFSLNLWSLLIVGTCLSTLAYAVRLVYNVYFHPLAKFPGPTLAGMTRWYENYYDLKGPEGGQYMYKIREMHEKYGPIVRIAPNELHINDPTYREVLYSNSQKRDKVPYMIDIFGTTLAVFGTEKDELHRLRRSALNPFFSKQAIQRLEGIILGKAQQMCERISAYAGTGQKLKLRHPLAACIVDITTGFSFGKCANALGRPDCSPKWEAMMVGVSEAVPVAKAFPGIVQVMQSLPIWLIRKLNPLIAAFAEFEQLIRLDIQEIFCRYAEKSPALTEAGNGKASNIFHEILRSSLPEHEKTIDRMTQEALSFVSAASETTSTTLATIVFYVATNPALESRLVEELRTVMPTPTSDVAWRDLEKLPFLSALIQEGLRLSVPVCGRIPLVARDTLNFREWSIPAGAYVGMSLGDALHHPEIYLKPLDFDPDRWLEFSQFSADIKGVEERRRNMKMAFVPFSRGARMCIGMHLAYANMYMILATMFRRFELRIVDTVRERDLDIARDYFVSKPSRTSTGISIQVVKERGS